MQMSGSIIAVSAELRARAQFATASRLVCALVNEAFTPALFLPSESATSQDPVTKGWALLVPESFLSSTLDLPAISTTLAAADAATADAVDNAILDTATALAIPLSHLPLLDSATDPARIRSVDPDDLVLNAPFLLLHPHGTTATRDPVPLWRLVARWTQQSATTTATVADELASSAHVQAYLYALAPPAPQLATASALDWEHAVLEGHATHPMHRTRSAAPPLAPFDPAVDLPKLAFPDLRFVQVPRDAVHVHGTWMSDVHSHLMQYLDVVCPDSHVLIPIHAMQVPWIHAHFPDFTVLDTRQVTAGAQASTRSVVPLDPAFALAHHVKLAVCLTITSAMRIITPFSIHNGPIMSSLALAANANNPLLTPVVEPATIGLCPTKYPAALAKSLGCILRANPETGRPTHERTIVCAALVERDLVTQTPHVVRAFALDTPASRLAWFAQYVRVLLAGVLPPLVRFGYAWEAHGQNMLVRVDTRSGEVVGFAARDFGGCQVYPPDWAEATRDMPKDVQELPGKLMPGSLQVGQTREAGWKIVYHTLFACHLHRLARALGVHRDGSGWQVVRQEVRRHVPRGSPLWKAWMETREVPAKALLKMKCDGLYRDYVYEMVPNVLLTGLVGSVEDEE